MEKFTSLRRSQVMVMVLTTTSTSDFCSAVTRSSADRIRYSTWDGAPKMSRAISPAMSTSKPVISPVIGSRKLNRLLPMSSPTISLPRARMSATAASASALLRNGRRLAVGLQSWLASSGGSGGSGGIWSMPTGVGGGSVGTAATVSDFGVAATRQHDRRGEHASAAHAPPDAGSSSILLQPGPQAERDRDGGAQAEHHAADLGARTARCAR